MTMNHVALKGSVTMKTSGIVYIVDDDEFSRNSLARFLESHRIMVEDYESSEQFIEAYCPLHPGCLLLDADVPGIHALVLQQQLIARNEHVPIVFMGRADETGVCVRAMRAGAVDFLVKPVSLTTTLTLVRRSLERDIRRCRWEQRRQQICRQLNSLPEHERLAVHELLLSKDTETAERNLEAVAASNSAVTILERLSVGNGFALARLLLDHDLDPTQLTSPASACPHPNGPGHRRAGRQQGAQRRRLPDLQERRVHPQDTV